MVKGKLKMIWALCLAMIFIIQIILSGTSEMQMYAAETLYYKEVVEEIPGMRIVSTDSRLSSEKIQLTGSVTQEGEEFEQLMQGVDKAGVLWELNLVDEDGNELQDVSNLTLIVAYGVQEGVKEHLKVYRIGEDGSKTEMDLVPYMDMYSAPVELNAIEDIDSLGKFLVCVPYMIGDIDGNSNIDAADALKVLKDVVKIQSLSEDVIPVADVDRDNEVTAEDALMILKYVVKIVDGFPQGKWVWSN